MRAEVKMVLSAESFETKKAFFVFFLPLAFFLYYAGHMSSQIAACDGVNALSPPPSPDWEWEDPMPPPEGLPVPQVVVPPRLAEPLIWEFDRAMILENRFFRYYVHGNYTARQMEYIINLQGLLEQFIETALVHDGYNPDSIIARYSEIRELIHFPRGELMIHEK